MQISPASQHTLIINFLSSGLRINSSFWRGDKNPPSLRSMIFSTCLCPLFFLCSISLAPPSLGLDRGEACQEAEISCLSLRSVKKLALKLFALRRRVQRRPRPTFSGTAAIPRNPKTCQSVIRRQRRNAILRQGRVKRSTQRSNFEPLNRPGHYVGLNERICYQQTFREHLKETTFP